MLRYLADVVLLLIICSIQYLVLRLRCSRERKAVYDSARSATGMPKDRV